MTQFKPLLHCSLVSENLMLTYPIYFRNPIQPLIQIKWGRFIICILKYLRDSCKFQKRVDHASWKIIETTVLRKTSNNYYKSRNVQHKSVLYPPPIVYLPSAKRRVLLVEQHCLTLAYSRVILILCLWLIFNSYFLLFCIS